MNNLDTSIESFDPHQMGMFLKQKRRESGKTLKDIADNFISTTTISSIERGSVSGKTSYLVEKLGCDLGELSLLSNQEKDKEQKIKNKIAIAETMINLSNPDAGLAKLKEIELSSTDSLAPLVNYLKGKCFYKKKKWTKAKSYFQEAVRLSPQTDPINIRTASLSELSAIAYFQNKLDEAISLAQQGIDSFNPDGERQYSIYVVTANKAIYLEKLDRNEEAMKVISSLWEQWNHIKVMDVLLNLYELKATILAKRKMYHDALKLLKEAIEIGRVNRFYQRAFSSWIKLGTIHMDLQEWDEAEGCFLAALSIQGNVSYHDSYILSEAYIELSSLYLRQKKWKQAEEMLEKALKLTKKHNDKLNLIKALIIKGDIYRNQRMFSEAVIPYKESLELSKECNYLHLQKEVLHNMAACWEKIDQKKFQSCLIEIYKLNQKKRSI